jgi:hypothetical protein
MDPLDRMALLAAGRQNLREKLYAGVLSKAERIAINRSIAELTAEITSLYRHLPGRSVRQFVSDERFTVGPPAACLLVSIAYASMYWYVPLRHRYAPYTASQMARRDALLPHVFKFGGRPPARARNAVAGSALLFVFVLCERAA